MPTSTWTLKDTLPISRLNMTVIRIIVKQTDYKSHCFTLMSKSDTINTVYDVHEKVQPSLLTEDLQTGQVLWSESRKYF